MKSNSKLDLKFNRNEKVSPVYFISFNSGLYGCDTPRRYARTRLHRKVEPPNFAHAMDSCHWVQQLKWASQFSVCKCLSLVSGAWFMWVMYDGRGCGQHQDTDHISSAGPRPVPVTHSQLTPHYPGPWTLPSPQKTFLNWWLIFSRGQQLRILRAVRRDDRWWPGYFWPGLRD